MEIGVQLDERSPHAAKKTSHRHIGPVRYLGIADRGVCPPRSPQPPRVSRRQPEFGVVVEKNLMIPVRDGVKLAADLYRPARDGKPAPGRFPGF